MCSTARWGLPAVYELWRVLSLSSKLHLCILACDAQTSRTWSRSGLLSLHLGLNKKSIIILSVLPCSLAIRVYFNFKCSLLQWTGIMTAFHVILNTTAWQNEAFPLQASGWNLKECCWLQSVLRAKCSVCALLSFCQNLKFWSKRLKQETSCSLSTERYKYKGTLKSEIVMVWPQLAANPPRSHSLPQRDEGDRWKSHSEKTHGFR